VRLVYYAFDLLHLDGSDISNLQFIERKALSEQLLAGKPGLQFNGHDTGDGELILKHAGNGDQNVWRGAYALRQIIIGTCLSLRNTIILISRRIMRRCQHRQL
jgi:hypothetical protein